MRPRRRASFDAPSTGEVKRKRLLRCWCLGRRCGVYVLFETDPVGTAAQEMRYFSGRPSPPLPVAIVGVGAYGICASSTCTAVSEEWHLLSRRLIPQVFLRSRSASKPPMSCSVCGFVSSRVLCGSFYSADLQCRSSMESVSYSVCLGMSRVTLFFFVSAPGFLLDCSSATGM